MSPSRPATTDRPGHRQRVQPAHPVRGHRPARRRHQSLSDYGGAILSLDATQAKNSSDQFDAQNALYQTLSNKAAADSGVNLDEEMGNMILLQNAYAASARVITTTSQLTTSS